MTNHTKGFCKNYLPTLLFVLFCLAKTTAQSPFDPSVIARQHLQKQATTWGLSAKDAADAVVSSAYRTEHNGVHHVHLTQRVNGIEIFNAVANVNILPTGEVIFANSQFLANAKSYNATPSLSAEQALQRVANHLNVKPLSKFQTAAISSNAQQFEFLPNGIAEQNIKVKLRYYPNETTQELQLAWHTDLADATGNDLWSVFVDAQTGAILHKHSYMVHCQFHDHSFANHDEDCRDTPSVIGTTGTQNPKSDTKNTPSVKSPILLDKNTVLNQKTSENPVEMLNRGTYRVFKYPAESPLTGAHELVVNPADAVASPYGWHDTTGTEGAEFTTTRGNNVHAFIDWFNSGRPSYPETDGGANLMFDFPYIYNNIYDSIANTASTNLFYANNHLHDVLSRHGFDEPSGNFQVRNYTRGGLGGDPVSARAQSSARGVTFSTNNATFGTPVDGLSGTMRMFLWTRSVLGTPAILTNLHVTAPSSITGDFQTSLVTFGPAITTARTTGDVIVFADSLNSALGCAPSRRSLAGKIALIDLGTGFNPACSPARKVLNAQDSGAIAVILVSNTTTYTQLMNDTTPSVYRQVRIPVVGINTTTATTLRNSLANNVVTVSIYRSPKDTEGPDLIDGDFENGIIAHELGHGVSNRLTGGPANSSCLISSNQTGTILSEQMGEGWSDFLALATTAKVGDRGEMRRGMGPYVLRQAADGRGIRRYQYSTDMTLNPQTYDSIYTSQASPHPVGEIWCGTLWDLYWKMVEKYGFDVNPYNFNSGNSKALRLVLDGMKFQACNPGFIEGRDGILAADRATFNGEHQCLIWDVFARRGIGFGADGGNPRNAGDNIESKERFPTCVKELKINKLVTPNIQPGQNITVQIRVINHKDQRVTNLTVSDDIPTGASFIAATASRPATVAGSSISFRLDSLRAGDTATISYQMSTSPTKTSLSFLSEGFESPINLFTALGTPVTKYWKSSSVDTLKNSGNIGFVVVGDATSDQTLNQTDPVIISGRQPVLRFAHKYVTEGGQDAGAVEIAEGTSAAWVSLHPQMFRVPARGLTFGTYPLTTKAFYGNSRGFVVSYVDLKNYIGKEIRIRFRFKSNPSVSSYWAVDDVQFMDMENYEASARVMSAEGDNVTAAVIGRGTVVEPTIRIATQEVEGLTLNVSPNPATDAVNVAISSDSETATLILHSIEGRELLRQSVLGRSNTPLSLSAYAAGMYLLTVECEGKKLIQKVVKQ